MKKIILTSLILFSLSATAIAEETLKAKVEVSDRVLELNIRQAVNMALEKNHKLNVSKNNVNISKKFIDVQKGDFLPSVNFNQGFVVTDNPAEVFGLKLNQGNITSADFAGAPGSFNKPGSQTNFLSEITLEQTVFNKGNFHKLKNAKNRYKAVENEYLRTQEKIVLEVARSFLGVQNAKNYVEVAQKSIDSAKEHNRIANVRYKNELGLYSDVLRTDTFLKKAEQRLVSAQKNYEVAKKALGLTIGTRNQVEALDEVPEIKPFELAVHKDNVLNRADIKAMEAGYEAAQEKVKQQRAMFYPEIKAGGNYQVYSEDAPFGYEGDNYKLYAMLGWNLFNGMKKPHMLQIAKYEREQAKEMLEEAKKQAEYEVFDAYQTVSEKRKNLELAESALKSAEEGMKLVEVRYKNSLSPVIDILDAQLNLDQARADAIRSQNEYLFSLINLSYMSGGIIEEVIGQPPPKI